MPVGALLLGLAVTVIWGLNFSLVKIAEEGFQPLLLTTLRFLLTCLPAIFVFPRPKVPFRYLVAYGFVFGALQWSLLFAGLYVGLSAGLASVVLQLQVFFTILFGIMLLHERIRGFQTVGIALGFAGVAVIGSVTDGTVSVAGLLLVGGAGLSWGLANVIAKKANPTEAVSFMVWASAVPVLPMATLTIVVEGVGSIGHSFSNLTWAIAGAVLYLVYPTTLFGYAVWNALLCRYPTSLVAPMTLLVPFFGVAGSMLIHDERVTAHKALAAGLMILGLSVNQLAGRSWIWRRAPEEPTLPAQRIGRPSPTVSGSSEPRAASREEPPGD